MTTIRRGRLSYTHETMGEFGREWFAVSSDAAAHRTLRCLCQIDPDGLTRDVTYTVDELFRARDCFVRLTVADRFAGAGWFRFGEEDGRGFGEGTIHTSVAGHMRQRLIIERPVKAFGTHPITADIWKLALLSPVQPGQDVSLGDSMNCSPLDNGGSGPVLARKSYNYVYRGEERIKVPAGTFDCRRWDWPVRPGMTLCMWTTEDFLPVLMTWPEDRKRYELVELDV